MGWKIAALIFGIYALGSILSDVHINKLEAEANKTHIAKLEGLIDANQDLLLAVELRRKLDVANEKLACAGLQVTEQAK